MGPFSLCPYVIQPESLIKSNTIMNKLNQFSEKVQYVTPSCKSVVLRSSQAILSASNEYGPYGIRSLHDGDGVNNDTSDWAY